VIPITSLGGGGFGGGGRGGGGGFFNVAPDTVPTHPVGPGAVVPNANSQDAELNQLLDGILNEDTSTLDRPAGIAFASVEDRIEATGLSQSAKKKLTATR
jgi:hypothetical protein